MKRLLLIWITLGLLANAEERIWKSTDGKELTGELLEDKGEALVLKIKGKTFTVPLSRLSEDDHVWVETYRNAVEERTKEDAALAGTTKTYAKNKDQQVTYHVYYPSSYNREKPLPMLILFSAGGGGRSILKNFKMSCEDVGWIGVGCDTFKNGVDESKLDPLFEELLPIIEKTVPHNSQALYMGGMSGGASRAFEYTAKFDRPWKGVIACGGWLGKRYDLKYAKDMRVAWVNGDNDKGAGSWFGRDSAFLKKKFGVTNKLFEFPGGHEIGAPTILTEAMTWAGSKDE